MQEPNPKYVDQSVKNEYGEKVVANVIMDVDDGVLMYRCLEEKWREAHDEWCKNWRTNKLFPQPMPTSHCMFVKPVVYGCVPFGCTDQAVIRQAMEAHVRNQLGNWLDMAPEDKRDGIVQATVDAKMKGESLGGAQFVACIYAGL